MRILITGGAGYIGSVAAGMLLRQGHRVRVLDNLLHGGAALLGLYPEDGFEFVRADVLSRECVAQAVDGMDAVVHLAAIVGDPACSRQKDLARAVNLDGSFGVFEAARKAGAQRFVFASTCSNYGRMSDPSQLVNEESPLCPVSLYAETKVAVEKALLAETGAPSVTLLRFATVYGISPRMRFDLTVNEFAQQLATTGELDVYGEQFWRPYIHVRDAARVIATVLNAPAETVGRQVFNAGDSEENFTKAQLIDLISSMVDRPVNIRRFHKAEDPRDYRVDFAKIRGKLDFQITRRVPDGVREVIDMVRGGVIADFSLPCYRN